MYNQKKSNKKSSKGYSNKNLKKNSAEKKRWLDLN